MVEGERDGWILMAARWPEKIPEFMVDKMAQLDDPRTVQLYRLIDELVEAGMDEDRLAAVADLMAEMAEESAARGELDRQSEDLGDDAFIALIDSFASDAHPMVERLQELMAERGWPGWSRIERAAEGTMSLMSRHVDLTTDGTAIGRCVVLPGRRYTPDGPLLFFAAQVALMRGWDVRQVWWEPPSFDDDAAEVAWVGAELDAAVDGYDGRVLVVGKSSAPSPSPAPRSSVRRRLAHAAPRRARPGRGAPVLPGGAVRRDRRGRPFPAPGRPRRIARASIARPRATTSY